ncbi:terminase family protein [Marinovum sp. 2_MG-2023]|uniref:DNA-packaging protein n=1 Tax=Marinovum sp. 2_MG-2023 TaxID=3062637 RepID=UPI0026E48AA5|nr:MULTISPECIES: terminase family protein [unclassified Marinovum]MDO6731026.1 terminase family protein [Marinovum sp. 2_MG-2023]MDO6778523.1 terminase family protein [Marinovum sp. 1_MG-2023]
MALPFLFEFWAHPHQLPPEGAWRSWVVLGGRGAGKTRAGAEWVRSMVEGARPRDPGRAKRLALVGETYDQVRDVMIFGDSGILQSSPPDRRPHWEASKRRLIWPNGAVAHTFSANDPEALRGPQFDGAWADELAKWPKGEDTWDMLQFALRLGEHPQACVTTTPRNAEALKTLLESPSTVVTRAPTEANRAHLAASFLEEVRARYKGSALARQELDGELLTDIEGALWTHALLDECRDANTGDFDRVVVAVDPPVSGHAGSDECGIVVAGVRMTGEVQDWQVHVLEDASIGAASPRTWAERAVEVYHRFQADRIVAEVNQGGALVEAVVRQVDGAVPMKSVHASRGKVARAEPVAALYEQGRVKHVPGLHKLEEQMCRMSLKGYEGKKSPDRVDALVWALTELVLDGQGGAKPAVRTL